MPNVTRNVCNVCSKRVSGKLPGLQCCGQCAYWYHAECVGLAEPDLKTLGQPGSLWKCVNCRANKRISVIFDPEPDHVLIPTEHTSSSNVNEPAVTTLLLRDIQEKLLSLTTKIEEMDLSVKFCSEKITDFQNKIDSWSEKMKSVGKLTEENRELKKQINTLNERVDEQDQYTRLNNVIINGVPEKNGENIYEIVNTIVKELDCTVTPNDVDVVHRIALHGSIGERPSVPRNILVKFLSRRQKENFIAAAKSKRIASQTRGLIVPGISSPIYINEHLSSKNGLLFKQLRAFSRENNYKYVWTRNCNLYMRKNEESRIIAVKSQADLTKLQS